MIEAFTKSQLEEIKSSLLKNNEDIARCFEELRSRPLDLESSYRLLSSIASQSTLTANIIRDVITAQENDDK